MALKSSKPKKIDELRKFKEAAREAGANMGKKEFGRVLGKIVKAKPKPEKVSSSSPSKEVPPS